MIVTAKVDKVMAESDQVFRTIANSVSPNPPFVLRLQLLIMLARLPFCLSVWVVVKVTTDRHGDA
jgi:hypothetical protein